MQIRAIADGFFHPVCQVPERIQSAFHRDGDYRADSVSRNDNVYIFGLQAAEDRSFTRSPLAWNMLQDTPSSAIAHDKRRPRSDVVGMESAFHDKTA